MEQLAAWLLRFVASDNVVLMGGMVVLLAPLELAFPAHKVPWRHYAFNLIYGLSIAVLAAILLPVTSAAIAFAIQKLGFGFIDLSGLGFGGIGGAVVAVLIGSLIFDFFFYWFHRLEHANAFLWQEHVVHHSDPYLNLTTAARGHIVETFLIPLFVTIPIAIFFKLPPVTIGVLSLVPLAWFYVAHLNVRWGFGPLWWLLASPDFHRIHHSLETKHFNKNFVLWFPIWDIVFGTAWRPRKGECPATGLDGVRIDAIGQAHLMPFAAWFKMMSLAKAPAVVGLQDNTRQPDTAPQPRKRQKRRRAR